MYQALYRKYRPKNFNDVVGQKYVVETLKNEIIHNKVNHAYMFFGPRGIGKTTIAKIFARAVNCEQSVDGNPCEKCEKCLVSKEKECIDIIEIDAASNNGVDEIREIRNKVNLVPAELKYKVYIIDEVHMLTQGAFNALLKTLEEPPKHVIFILATTDPQKVSDTIISRCQCFSFKRISEQENFGRLKQISNIEQIKIDDEVLKEISLYSDGGLRDSLGILDKLSSYKTDKIILNDFYEMNDMIDIKSIESLLKSIINNNISDFLSIMEKYNNNGKNIIEIMNQLLYYLKDKIVNYYQNSIQIDNIDLLQALLQLINEKMFDIKRTSKPYIYVEILLLQFINQHKNISREIFEQPNNEKINIETSNKSINNEKNPDEKQSLEDTKLEKEKSNSEVVEIEELDQLKKLMKIRVNNALAKASKIEKQKDLELLNQLNDYVFDSDKGYAASELLNANLCVSSPDIMVMSYEYESVVEQNLKQIDLFCKVFNELTNSNKKLAIITTEEWNKEKNQYIEFTKQGNKYKIIEEPNLIKESLTTLENNNLNSSPAVDLFGDIVEIK